MPSKAHWNWLQVRDKLPTIGKYNDDAMDAIEKDNPTLKGVLPKDYARPSLDKQRLGELIDLIGSISLSNNGSGKAKDVLGFVFEYFLGQFADAEGKKGGQFYTPQSIVNVLVDVLAPEPEKRVYDGACGSGGMFVQSERFIETHEHRKGKISIFGQESNPTTYKLAKMNLAICGIDAKIELGDTLMHDKFPELKVDYVIANPPFNVSDYNINLLSYQYFEGVDLLAIEGVSYSTVLTLMSEVGNGIHKFETAKQFASWLRLSPNNKISGGKVLSNKIPKGSKCL